MIPTRSFLFGLAFLSLSATASFAQGMMSLPSGPYVRGDVGGAFGVDTSFKDTNSASTSPVASLGTTTQPSSTGNSFIFGGGVGYRFTPAFRTDLTLDYIPSLSVSGHNSSVSTVTNKADLSSLVTLLNGYVDINGLLPNGLGPFQPYVTGGVGFAYNDLGNSTIGGSVGGAFLNGISLSGRTVTNFAWGAGAGLGYAVTPNLTIDLGYKYIDLGEMRTGSRLTIPGGTIGVTGDKADLQVHTVMLGLRWTFGAPPAPPPPAAVPASAPPPPPPAAAAKQEFIVFFDFDKSTLTVDGQKVVDAAAAAYKRGGSAKISIAGYTDRAGTPTYNMALSQRRANTVNAALVKDGVPANQIVSSAFGEERNRVPTADGVREPQNRRVEIDF